MEILLPSTGSMAMAGVKGSDARSASSCGVGGGGASACARPVAVLIGGASSVSIGGGSTVAGRRSEESIVRSSDFGFGVDVDFGFPPQPAASAAAIIVIAIVRIIIVPGKRFARGWPLHFGEERRAASLQSSPHGSFDCRGIDDSDQIVAIPELATENAAGGEID